MPPETKWVQEMLKPEIETVEPAPTAPTPQEESSGRILLNSITSAAKSLEICAAHLETNASLLETMRADSTSINSLAAGVNITMHQPQKQRKLHKVRATSKLLGIG